MTEYNKLISNLIVIDDNDDVDEFEDAIENEEYIIQNTKLCNIDSPIISEYIVNNSVRDYNSKAIMCNYLWSGIDQLDKWELNRKVDENHVKQIYNELRNDYKKNKEFYFYDPIHIAVKKDNIFYVIDGQHRLLAYHKLFLKNKYPIQKIPCIIWFPETDEEFIEIFDKINSRLKIDRSKLFNYKITDLINLLEQKYATDEYTIFGKNRPKINKELFINKMRENDNIHKLETSEIFNKIKIINRQIRGLPRNKRSSIPTSDNIHKTAEYMNFYLGYDKDLMWINDI